jgi:hypothetical protein
MPDDTSLRLFLLELNRWKLLDFREQHEAEPLTFGKHLLKFRVGHGL